MRGALKSVSFWRLASRWGFFVLLVYGAFIFPRPLETEMLPETKAPAGAPSTARFNRSAILWASDDPPRIDTYPPSAVCRFNPKGGTFKACILHFLSENFTWGTHWKYLLPHLAFFTLLAAMFGRLWCGWVCPLGSAGDTLCWLRKKLGMDHLKFGNNVQRTLKIANWGILVFALGISALIFLPFFGFCRDELFLPYCQVCPARLVFPLCGGTVPNWKDFSTPVYGTFTVLGWSFAVLFVLGFFTGKNVWCRLCPIGTFTSFFNRGGGASIVKDREKCSSCGVCADACPVASLEVLEDEKGGDISHADCIMCLKCVEMCPKDGCLKFKLFGMRLAESSFKPVAGQGRR